ncbi:hypothetical protein V5O48_019163, partial [Marasmius crinis-equi]
MMTTGARWDTMDDFCNSWNWRKVVGTEENLLKKLVKAVSEAVVHYRAFEVLNEGIQTHHASEVAQWKDMIHAWEADTSKPCPYEVATTKRYLTIAKIKKDLADEEHRREAAGINTLEVAISGMIIEGLEIEEA